MIVKKHERTLNGFDDKVISLYSRGMSTRDIQAHLKEIYGVNQYDAEMDNADSKLETCYETVCDVIWTSGGGVLI